MGCRECRAGRAQAEAHDIGWTCRTHGVVSLDLAAEVRDLRAQLRAEREMWSGENAAQATRLASMDAALRWYDEALDGEAPEHECGYYVAPDGGACAFHDRWADHLALLDGEPAGEGEA